MNNIPYIDILILAMIAVFIVNRLRNVLGKKTGNEHDIVEKFSKNKTNFKESPPDQISENKDRKTKKPRDIFFHQDPTINDNLRKIHKLDNNFDLQSFLDGSKKAFEFIIKNYSEENLDSIKSLLSKNIFNDFDAQIKKRIQKSQDLDITIIGIKNAEIVSANLRSSNATISVKFSSEQVHILKDPKGKVIEGDSNQILTINEDWTFSKNMKNKDPNWALEKIEESK